MKHAALITALFPTIPEKRCAEAEERLREYLSFVRALAERLIPAEPQGALTANGDSRTLDSGRTFTSHHNDTEI